MKPRLEPAPMTQEDVIAWYHVNDRFSGPEVSEMCLWDTSGLVADRRDADLMLLAQEIAARGPAAIELHGIACRGWMCDELVYIDSLEVPE